MINQKMSWTMSSQIPLLLYMTYSYDIGLHSIKPKKQISLYVCVCWRERENQCCYKNHSFSPFFLLLLSGNHFVLFFLYRPLSYYSFFRFWSTCLLPLSVCVCLCVSVCLCEMFFSLYRFSHLKPLCLVLLVVNTHHLGKKFHKEVLTRVGQAVNLDWFYFFLEAHSEHQQQRNL